MIYSIKAMAVTSGKRLAILPENQHQISASPGPVLPPASPGPRLWYLINIQSKRNNWARCLHVAMVLLLIPRLILAKAKNPQSSHERESRYWELCGRNRDGPTCLPTCDRRPCPAATSCADGRCWECRVLYYRDTYPILLFLHQL